jgi:release factor glutamine methyltransferase
MSDPVKSNASVDCDQTIETLLRGNALPRLELTILLAHALGMTRTALLANADETLTASAADRFRQLVARRTAGEPIAYLVGNREFYSLDLTVTPDVLIPRPETEHLVDAALDSLRAAEGHRSVLDLGTGSGAIAIAIARNHPDATVVAIDVSSAALRVAETNARRQGVDIELIRSDWYEAIGARRFDIIVSNPPYVRADDPHLESGDVRFEPRVALVSGGDGLAAIRRIVAGAPAQLADGGRLLFEHGYDQGEVARRLLEMAGFTGIRTFVDLAGHERVSGGLALPARGARNC